MERIAQGAAQAELARSYGVSHSRPLAGWLRQALSRQARSAREEAEKSGNTR
jgi:transposase-like protein